MISENAEQALGHALANLPLGGVRFFERVGSTMDEAASWVEQGAPDLALVVADEQTAGRGRFGRRWFTAPKASLAFSLTLRQVPSNRPTVLSGLGALAVCEALEKQYNLQPQIKWPNDVLLNGRKVCGILIESHWQGEAFTAAVIGVGINIAPSAVPPMNAALFPATCLQDNLPVVAGAPIEVNRFQFLAAILERLLAWRPHVQEEVFIQSWEARLAYRHQTVQVLKDLEDDRHLICEGTLEGLNAEGNLILRQTDGENQIVNYGEIRLRPIGSYGGDSDVVR